MSLKPVVRARLCLLFRLSIIAGPWIERSGMSILKFSLPEFLKKAGLVPEYSPILENVPRLLFMSKLRANMPMLIFSRQSAMLAGLR